MNSGDYCKRVNCPWYDEDRCTSPNDHTKKPNGEIECDYDRGILPYDSGASKGGKVEMTRNEIIRGLEREIKSIQMEPDSKMFGVCITVDAAEDIVALLKKQEAQNECLMKKCVICPHCANCDVDDNGLLKGQGARLLTIEEITGDGECWFEGINGAYGYADCYMCTGNKEVEVHRINMDPEYVSWDDFKKKWRCWTFRPTDKQRKNVKWE